MFLGITAWVLISLLSMPSDAQLWKHKYYVTSLGKASLSVWGSNMILLLSEWNHIWDQDSSKFLPLQLFQFLNIYQVLTLRHSLCRCYENHKDEWMVFRLKWLWSPHLIKNRKWPDPNFPHSWTHGAVEESFKKKYLVARNFPWRYWQYYDGGFY